MTFDPITTGIIAAVGVGLAKVGETAVVDAYNGVKSLIVKKFGKESQLKKAVDALEERPDSESRKGMVKEEVEAAKAHEDADLLAAAKTLLAALEKLEQQRPGVTGLNYEQIRTAFISIGTVTVKTEGQMNVLNMKDVVATQGISANEVHLEQSSSK